MKGEPAFIWDENKQLSGSIFLSDEEVIFQFRDFGKSHLSLKIAYTNIIKIEIFVIYNLSINGLKIVGKNQKEDLFILQNPKALKKEIEQRQKNLTR